MLEGAKNRGFVGDVERLRQRPQPLRLEGLGDRGEFPLIAAVENDFRPGRGEAPRDREPEAVRGSGDESRLAGEIEEMGDAHRRAHRARSTRIGVWSEALSRPRMALSMTTERSRSAAWGESMQVIDADAVVLLPRAGLIVPERVQAPRVGRRPQGVGQAERHELAEFHPRLGQEQRVVNPHFGNGGVALHRE